jgi:hypothetical protein
MGGKLNNKYHNGFIIIDIPDYLEPYDSAVKDIDKQLGNLNMLLNSKSLCGYASRGEAHQIPCLL